MIGTRLVSAAAHGLHRTSYMKATKGRASFLGERSVGHLDPGACSSALLVGAVVRVLEDQAGIRVEAAARLPGHRLVP